MFKPLFGGNLIALGFLATIGTGLATGIGALPVLIATRVSDRLLDAMLGFAAGVMLAATAFSLLVPAIELGGVWITILGLLMGAIFLAWMDRASLISTSSPAQRGHHPPCAVSGSSS